MKYFKGIDFFFIFVNPVQEEITEAGGNFPWFRFQNNID